MQYVLARFELARRAWIQGYLQALSELRESSPETQPELLLQLSDSVGIGVHRLLRVDFVAGTPSDPKLTEFNLNPIFDEDPISGIFDGGMVVSARPLHWNGIEFAVGGIDEEAEPLARWCTAWIDADETGREAEPEMLGAIHSITTPQAGEDGEVLFSVDFGTAPVRAVIELLEALRSAGANDVRAASTWGYCA